MRILRATLAAIVGAVVTLSLYLTWFFKITHQVAPWDGAPVGFIVLTGVIAAVVGLLGGYLAAMLAPETPRGAAEGAAGFIALVALFAETHTPGQHHYAQMVALLVAAPAAYFIGRTRPVLVPAHFASQRD
ncbi:MAG: hypothetical protein ACRYGF_10670 [Janthinobacterium lividum]